MSPSTLEGQTLGKYRLLEALGRGGMAQVYRGYHPQLDRYVAVKVLRADLVEQGEFLERFRREAHAVSGLRHANIVQVFDFDAQDDLYFMVMELLEGDTLRARQNEYRARGERMPLDEAVRVTRDALAGLEYAHSEGVIHRDLKPANIMLTKKGQAVLTDFGIAQIVGATQVTVSGALMGTLSYMAPEQGLKGIADARSDIYSLGIVLYEMLTGYTPFDADTPLAILMKHLNDPLPLPGKLDPSLPAALEQVVLKALAKDPADRYQSAAEMSAALDDLAGMLPAEARPPAPRQLVYSGEARRRLTGDGMLDADTDRDLRPGAASRQVPAPRTGPGPVRPISAATAVFAALGFFMLCNMLAVMQLTLLGNNVFVRGWPFEVLLASAFFGLLAWGAASTGLLIPALIVLGNGLLLGYTAATGRWQDWAFLWMLEPLIVFAAIYFPIRLNKQPDRAAYWSRTGGALLAAVSVLLAAAVFIRALFF
ncbi:MAG: protein kinase domain-containing protein [Chloroflexota bacterium]